VGSYEVVRMTTVGADPATVHALIDDLHRWPAWSPWEDLDPDLRRSYTGAEAGVGAHYAWEGNRKAGTGSMEITASTVEEVEIALAFVKPFRSTSTVTFELLPTAAGTDVTWRMTGEQKGAAALFGKVVSMDKLVGKDMEKGLARLKGVAETGA
jgi:hypothetical protein